MLLVDQIWPLNGSSVQAPFDGTLGALCSSLSAAAAILLCFFALFCMWVVPLCLRFTFLLTHSLSVAKLAARPISPSRQHHPPSADLILVITFNSQVANGCSLWPNPRLRHHHPYHKPIRLERNPEHAAQLLDQLRLDF